jgi:pseudouridine-5'-phosphate glycosidase
VSGAESGHLLDPKSNRRLQVSHDVQDSLDRGLPVVALESTLISHGLPYPENLETARLLEATVREHGATPATIAVLGGLLRIGVTLDELRYLATSDSIRKVSRRDLPIMVAQKGDGATTVAATMAIAAIAGIEVFATGGIGGVHRGEPFDISADLVELTQTPITVVCSGAKAILDLPFTLEWLETHGVPVLGYGTDTFPAFYSRSSGLAVDARVDKPEEVVRIVRAKRELGLRGGVLVAVPVPVEQALPLESVDSAIEAALADAKAAHIRGPQVTPYLLARVAELTAGNSKEANVALLRNNAAVAATIATALRQETE